MKTKFLIILIILLNHNFSIANDLKFVVAGHSYGSHFGNNDAIYPKLLKILYKYDKNDIDFIVFNGDIVRVPKKANWELAKKQFSKLKVPYYLVMGNHDFREHGVNFFREKHKKLYYEFSKKGHQFIVLNSMYLTNFQMDFLDSTIKKSNAKNIFVFMHHLMWDDNPKYEKITTRSHSLFYKLDQQKNYWTDMHPILEKYVNKNIYVIAGDICGPQKMPAFYDKIENITFIATGMGEIDEENILIVKTAGKNVHFELKALNKNVKIRKLQYYNTKNLEKYNKPKPKTLIEKIIFYKQTDAGLLGKMIRIVTHMYFYIGIIFGIIIGIVILKTLFIRKK